MDDHVVGWAFISYQETQNNGKSVPSNQLSFHAFIPYMGLLVIRPSDLYHRCTTPAFELACELIAASDSYLVCVA